MRGPTDDDGTIELLRNGTEVLPAWLAAIESARQEIVLEMYWFASDATGRRFAHALCERARAGVQVLLIYDALGSFGFDPDLLGEMVTAGIHVREFNPVAPWRARFRWAGVTVRDHRKVLVVDSAVGFTGGVNLCDQAASVEQGGGGWRDDGVRITGRAVHELRTLFFDTWFRIGGVVPALSPGLQPRDRRQLNAAARREVGQPSTPPPSTRRAPAVQVLGHNTWTAQRTLRNLYARRIRSARERVYIANAYFVPDNKVRRALAHAARRGVDVRVIVPERSDVASVAWAGRALFAALLRAGVHVHYWTEGMMHAKTAVIDRWATVGSYNLDYRSLRYNLEVNVASERPDFSAAVTDSFRSDLARCRAIDVRDWARRPWHHRMLEWLAFLVRKIL